MAFTNIVIQVVLLIVGFAGHNITNTLIVFGIVIVIFIVYNIILLRKFIFKRRKKLKSVENIII